MTLDLDAPPSIPTVATDAVRLRPRRLRRTQALRALVRETRLHSAMLVAPLFVRPGTGVREPIGSMPGVARLSADVAADEASRLAELGIGGVILFGGGTLIFGIHWLDPRARVAPRDNRRHVSVRIHRPRALRAACG